jgi:hypothetical protein
MKRRTSWLVCWAVISVGSFQGCSEHSSFKFDALDNSPPPQELSEFSLGKYSIPIPVAEDRGGKHLEYRHRFQLNFELHALVSPTEKSHVSDSWARHEGKIRDQVIRVCRNATLDELQEPEFSTLKTRLMHALAGHIGGKDMRQLLITEVVSQQL